MIIKLENHSKYKNIIFVHPPRTGGTSIEAQIINALDYPNKHECANYFESVWDESFSFATVRNPFDILVSKYSIGWYHSHDCVIPEHLDLKSKFLEWLECFVSLKGKIHENEKGNSLSDYLSKDPNFIIRYENRNDDILELNSIFREKLGISLHISPEVRVSESSRTSYKDYYNSRAIEIASEFYKQDLERFNYTF